MTSIMSWFVWTKDLPIARVGLNYPINFTDYWDTGWPAFLLKALCQLELRGHG